MVGRMDYTGVPTTTDLENNSHQKKYTVNRYSSRGLEVSRPLCALMAIGALLLAVLVGLLVFFLAPRYCNGEDSPEALVRTNDRDTLKAGILLDERHESTESPTSSTVKVEEEEEEVDERLPRSIEPTHYRIQIVPDLLNLSTNGSVKITLVPTEDTNKIIFHVNNIIIDKGSVSVVPAKPDSRPFPINDQDYVKGQKYRIVLNDNLREGREYQLELKFNGELNTHLQGFYRSRYHDASGRERYTASTQFSPTDARRAFPCFDEPAFKAKFTISLARPRNMSTLSNMPLRNTEPSVNLNNMYWDHYPETPKIPTYLVAFMVHDLMSNASVSDKTTIKVWSRDEYLSQIQYAQKIAPKILHYFENYFDIQFPLPKIDIVAVPEFGFNAMENWGLITFRESSLLYDPALSTNKDKRTIATILSHEIAHQWFGNLVTPKWWDDLWLKEGFATYLQYFGVSYTEPTWKIVEEFLPSETSRAMALDSLESTRPISFAVKNSKQIRQAFDEISYAKGACIIRMMNNFLGDEVFKNGLISFLKKYQGGNADRQDLFSSLTIEAHQSGVLRQNETVKDIMDTWTEMAGFPVITAKADYEKNKLHISQKRFYLTDKDEKSTWWVPLSFTTEYRKDFSDTRPKFWLRGEYETTEDVKFGGWYLLNINHTGYFIVNYDEQNWKTLIDSVMDLPPLIRAQLISDSMDLARANLLNYDIPLKLIAKMAIQDDAIMLIPTLMAFKKLTFLSDILSATPVFGLFEEYHKTIFKNTYDRVTFIDDIDDYITRKIRETVLEWSCRSPESICAHESRTRFRNLMIHGTRVEPNLREIVYCTAIRDGNEIEWDYAYNKYMTSTSTSERNALLDALGCTKLRWLLSRYLDKLMVDDSIRIQDADRVFESVAKNKIGTSIAFDFLRKNWNELLTHYGDGFNIIAKMIKSLAAHMNTEFQLYELERFRDSVKRNLSTASMAFDSAIETVRANVEWMNQNYAQVEQWLHKNKDRYAYLET